MSYILKQDQATIWKGNPMPDKLDLIKISAILLLVGILLIGCAPSEDAIEAVMAQTEGVKPTQTDSPVPTNTLTPSPVPTDISTPTPTETNSLTPSETPTSTPTFTPTPDIRIISLDSHTFLLEKADLPEDAKYFLPGPDWISPHINQEIIQGWGTDAGREYIEKTGRIGGWWVFYARGTNTVMAPEEIYHNIIQYETNEGALLTITEFPTDKRNDIWSRLNRDIDIGGISHCYLYKETQPNGKIRVWYLVETAYRNYVSIVQGYGWEDELSYEYVDEIAKIIIKKLEAAPLEIPK
jgi:hypothetical protein